MQIKHNKPEWDERIINAVSETIKSGYLGCGEKVKEVERKWSELVDSEDAAMVSSGVSAIRLALKSLGIQKDDEVIIPAYSCVALHNAILSLRARYILADINLDNLTINIESVKKKITDKTKAIIAVHLFGSYAYIDNLKQFKIPIIEDMAHGDWKLSGDLAISSFGPTKLINANSGGIVSGRKDLIDFIKDYRDYGDKSPSLRQNDLPNDLTAAIVLEKLKQLQEMQLKRIQLYNIYNEDLYPLCRNFKLAYRYVVQVPDAKKISEEMKNEGVYAEQPVWDYRDKMDYWSRNLKNTDLAFEQILSLPFYLSITKEEQKKVVEILKEIMNEK